MHLSRSIGLVAALASAASAHAAITAISNGGIIHANPSANIGLPDNNQANVIQGFDEVQGFTLTDALEVFSYGANANIILAAGTVVSSHMVIFDPSGLRSANADVTFSEPILGIIYTDESLFASHTLLGRAGVNYPNTNLFQYGFENTESANLIGTFTLHFTAEAQSPGDRFRVITYPTPGALAMGAIGLVFAGRRRR